MKDNKKTQKEKDPIIVTKTRADNSIEVEIKKSPSKTVSGKITIVIIVLAMAILPLIGLIIVLAAL